MISCNSLLSSSLSLIAFTMQFSSVDSGYLFMKDSSMISSSIMLTEQHELMSSGYLNDLKILNSTFSSPTLRINFPHATSIRVWERSSQNEWYGFIFLHV